MSQNIFFLFLMIFPFGVSRISVDFFKTRLLIFDHSLGAIDYAKAFDCVEHKKLWKILKEME